MKKWWKDLTSHDQGRIIAGLALMFFVFVAMPVIILFFSYINNTGMNRIIYDSTDQQIMEKLSPVEWLKNKASQEKRYYFIPEEISFVDFVGDTAYKSEFRLPKEDQAIKNFLTDEMLSSHESLNDLKKTVSRCVTQMARQEYKAEAYPSINIRVMSIGNMNKLCPVAKKFGYEWSGDLLISQCASISTQHNLLEPCMEIVRHAPY